MDELGKFGCCVCWMFRGVEEVRYWWDSCIEVYECLFFVVVCCFMVRLIIGRIDRFGFLVVFIVM